MDAVELLQAHERMCAYYQENCGDCPLCHMDSCGMGTKKPELLVDIVRKWTAEHCEVSKADESRNVLELMVALTDKIKAAENMIEESRRVTDAAFGKVDERFAEVDAQIALCMRKNSGTKEKNKRKRRRKYALFAVLPHLGTSVCPKIIDKNYKCDKRKLCAVCKHEFWDEEVEG